MNEPHRTSFAIPVDHPALPGHFPGSPVVPGVVVLDQVLKSMEQWTARPVHVSGLRQVKFHTPLLPAEQADVTLELAGETLRFQVTRAELMIAQGTFVLGAPISAASNAAAPVSARQP
jgi:3-hydroxyacyl-[acyl-carrier-protein] dehydratase